MIWRVSVARAPCATFLPTPGRGGRQPSATQTAAKLPPGSPGGGAVRAQDPLSAGQSRLQQRDRPGGPGSPSKEQEGLNGKQAPTARYADHEDS